MRVLTGVLELCRAVESRNFLKSKLKMNVRINQECCICHSHSVFLSSQHLDEIQHAVYCLPSVE